MSAPVAIYLMRHGEPALTGRLLGHTDCEVTPAGIAACREAADGLAVEVVISSDLRRAMACAEAVSGTVRIDPRWRELDFGAWDGLAAGEVDQAALGRFWDDPDAAPPPGGERWSAIVARVGAALGELDRPTLVVNHAGAMRAALAAACGLDHRGVWAVDLPYAAVLALRLWPGERPSAQITGLW